MTIDNGEQGLSVRNKINNAITAFENMTVDNSPSLASPDHLVPIIPSANGLPSVNASTLLEHS